MVLSTRTSQPRGLVSARSPTAGVALLALDDEQGLAGENEEVFVIGLPVLHLVRLAPARARRGRFRPAESPCHPGSPQTVSPSLAVTPASFTGIQDEPSVRSRHESDSSLFERGLGNHCPIIEAAR
jgi:hypothetical protein